MVEVFRRPHLATELAARLLRPGVLDEGLRSGLFLSGLRRTGKTTFLRNALVPELDSQTFRKGVDQGGDRLASVQQLPEAPPGFEAVLQPGPVGLVVAMPLPGVDACGQLFTAA